MRRGHILFRVCYSPARETHTPPWLNPPGPRYVLFSPAYAPRLTPPQLPQSKSLVYIDNDLNKATPATSRANSPETTNPVEAKDASSVNGTSKPDVKAPPAKAGPAKIAISAQTAQAPMSYHSHLQGSAVSDTSFIDEHHHHHPQSGMQTPPVRAPMGSPSANMYASSPRRNQYTGVNYNGISAGVVPTENLGKQAPSSPSHGRSAGGGAPNSQSLAGHQGAHVPPGAVGLAGVAHRGGVKEGLGQAPEVHAEADEYYGGKEVWSRSRTYSNASEFSLSPFARQALTSSHYRPA